MKVRVDKETCLGDETCIEGCPEVFEMQGDVAVVKMENVPKNLEGKVKEAATSPLSKPLSLNNRRIGSAKIFYRSR